MSNIYDALKLINEKQYKINSNLLLKQTIINLNKNKQFDKNIDDNKNMKLLNLHILHHKKKDILLDIIDNIT
jgi:hypothetical protein